MGKSILSIVALALALALAVCGLALAAPSRAAAVEDPQLASESFTLPNGLRVVLHEDHATPSVAVVLWFRVGSKDEVPGRTGFAHLFEHLMFKGSKQLPDGEMDRILEEAGGWSTAFTNSDETVYIDQASSNFLEIMLWLEADRLSTLLEVFDKAKLDNQRDVVQNERRQGLDNQPYGMAGVLIGEALWPKGHGYHWPTIGSHEDLVAASVADVKGFFRNYYVPGNATLVVAGDFEPKAARALVERHLGVVAKGATPRRPSYAVPAPIKKQVELSATDEVQVPRVYVTWRGPVAYAADEPALDLAAVILGGDKPSRLHRRLVYGDKIAQSVRVRYSPSDLGGEFQIVVTAKPGVSTATLSKAIDEEVARLVAAPPDAAELESALNMHEAALLAELESIVSRALRLAGYDAKLHDAGYLVKDVARYRAVTREGVQRAAARWLASSARVVLTLVPKESK